MKQNNIFRLLQKKEKKTKFLVRSIMIMLILFNVCAQIFLINSENISKKLMENNNLMLIQMFGYSEEKDTCFFDYEKAKKIEHVCFITESFPVVINLYDQSGEMTLESVIIHKIPKEFSEYVGIDNMEENTIYCPADGLENVENYALDSEYQELGIKLVRYDQKAPAILKGEDFVTEETFEKLKKMSPDADIVYSTPEYLIGVDSTENVFEVEKALIQLYDEYDVEIFYQAMGLENLVSGSEKIFEIQIIILIILFIASAGILSALLISIINSMNRELMVIHINGMSKKRIKKEFYGYLLLLVGKNAAWAEIISFMIYFILVIVVFHDVSILKNAALLLLMNFMVIGINVIGVKSIVGKKIEDNISNEKISGVLRN